LIQILGNCPYCKEGSIEARDIQVQGKALKLYACSNAHWHFETDFAELTPDSTCGFRIFQNQLQRWHKKSILPKEIRTLLREGQLKVKLYSTKTKSEYFKWVVTDEEYGISVLWGENIDTQ